MHRGSLAPNALDKEDCAKFCVPLFLYVSSISVVMIFLH